MSNYSSRNLYVSLTAGFIVCCMSIAQAWVISSILSALFISSCTNAILIRLLCLFLLFSLLKAFGIWSQEYLATCYALRTKENIRKDILIKIFSLLPSTSQTELISLFNNQFDSLEAYFREYIPAVYLAIITPVTFLIVIFALDLYSGLILLVTAPLIPLFMILIGNKAKSMTEKQWKILSYLSFYFLDSLQGLTTLKIFGKSKDRIKRISEITEDFRLSTMKTLKIAFVSSLTIELVSTLSIAIAAVGIGLRLLYGKMDYFSAIFVLILAPELYYPLRNLASKFHAGLEGKIAKRKTESLIELEEKRETTSRMIDSPFPIELKNINFSYDGKYFFFRNFSLKIWQGQAIGIKGRSGSGKTSFIKLLTGLEKPSSGEITFNGNRLSKKQQMSFFSWVPQTPYIFNKSIRENILLGSESVTEEELIKALEISCLDEFVSSLENGLQTVVGERGMILSAGQVQKIAIARAVIRNAPILIMDEATSSIDVLCEEKLLQNIEAFASSKTVIFASHRSGVLKKADIIVDLDNI